MTNPSHLLLVAQLRRQEERIEQLTADLQAAWIRNVELKRRADNLLSMLNFARKSRDMWEARAKAYRHRWKVADSNLRGTRRLRDLWKERALTKTPQTPPPSFPRRPIEWVEDEVA